jgi:response regulator RpfG family c-di-GMP phosphodiesterase
LSDDSRAPRILLIDGDRLRRDRNEAVLRHAGYEVSPAASGREGLSLALEATPDAVVSDVLMPGLDGYELTLELRGSPATRGVPVILTSGAEGEGNPNLVNAVGGTALVAGSPDLREVLGALAVCLGPRAPVRAPRERVAAQSVELAFLAGFGVGISSGADADRLLDEVLARCAEVTGYQCGAAYLSAPGGRPRLRGQVGFSDTGLLTEFFGDPGLLTDAVATAQAGIARIPSARLDPGRTRAVLARSGLASLLVAPVIDGHETLGVLVLGSPRAGANAGDDVLIAAIAGQVARWLSRVRTISALSHSQRRTVERLARAAEFRDEETANHTERVSRYCGLLATQAGLDEHRSELIAAASMMHDIGKLGIPDSILRKPGALNIHERLHMQRHADYGRKILLGEADPLLDLAATIAWTHHERWDGDGYPRRLGGAEIPLEGRIAAIGDVFDALTSNRIYRPAMSVDHAVRLMRAGRGAHFDPQLLDLFIDALPQVLEIRRRHPDRIKSDAEPAGAGLLGMSRVVPGSWTAFDHARALACGNRRFTY